MSIDSLVLFGIAAGGLLCVLLLRRRGLRGTHLLTAGWIASTGVVLAVSMAAHCADVVGRWHAGQGHDGAAWVYDFRVYSLLVLGVTLAACGARLVRAAFAFARPEGAWVAATRNGLLLVLALVAPLVPVHAVFAAPLAALAGIGLLLTTAARPT